MDMEGMDGYVLLEYVLLPDVVEPMTVACSTAVVEVSRQPPASQALLEQQPRKWGESQTYHCCGAIQVLSRSDFR